MTHPINTPGFIGTRKLVENFGVIGQVPHSDPDMKTFNVTLALDSTRAVQWSVFARSAIDAVIAALGHSTKGFRADLEGIKLIPLAVELAGDPMGIKYLTTKFLDLTQDDTFTLKPGTRVFIMDSDATPESIRRGAEMTGKPVYKLDASTVNYVMVVAGGAVRAYFLEVDRCYWIEGSDGVWYAGRGVAP